MDRDHPGGPPGVETLGCMLSPLRGEGGDGVCIRTVVAVETIVVIGSWELLRNNIS